MRHGQLWPWRQLHKARLKPGRKCVNILIIRYVRRFFWLADEVCQFAINDLCALCTGWIFTTSNRLINSFTAVLCVKIILWPQFLFGIESPAVKFNCPQLIVVVIWYCSFGQSFKFIRGWVFVTENLLPEMISCHEDCFKPFNLWLFYNNVIKVRSKIFVCLAVLLFLS